MSESLPLHSFKDELDSTSDSSSLTSRQKLRYERTESVNWTKRCWPFNACQTIDPEDKRKALVKKNGGYRIFLAGLNEHRQKYIADLYFTLVDLEWKYAMVIVFTIYLVSFLLFATFWWMMAYYNGDFDNLDNPKHDFCLEGVKSFPGAILFSLETQTTIGYGVAYPNAMCGPTIPLMYLQVVLGFLIETFMLGLIIVKIARPKYRANTILFSKYATVCQEDGKLVLQIRVGDLRKSHLVDASITGMIIRRHRTPEGAYYPLYQFRCDFSANEMGDQVFLLWPIVLTHTIDKSSPLYSFRPADLNSDKFELIVYLTGTVESTGEVCQARSSYLPKEILWGFRFERVEEYDRSRQRWQIDFAGFDDVIHCQNICHSAKELDEMNRCGD
ncbi:G protein-activated inward rectifier potassium channel 1 [Bulinus truncatus]|nr:G protein-activated inward rectifier potassium channel 1 [Bulinus truncatus]